LVDVPNGWSISKAVTVSTPNTWQEVEWVIPAETTQDWDTDNEATSVALALEFYLAAGPDFQSGSLQTTWGAKTTANRAVGQTNLAATVSNFIRLTDVQLEIGGSKTDFDRRPYYEQLSDCRLYYEIIDYLELIVRATSTTAWEAINPPRWENKKVMDPSYGPSYNSSLSRVLVGASSYDINTLLWDTGSYQSDYRDFANLEGTIATANLTQYNLYPVYINDLEVDADHTSSLGW
jgi:hypothetical protein